MSTEKHILEIQLLDRKLQIKVPADKFDELQKAAAYFDSKMRDIRDSKMATGNERIALMAGLDLAHEVISQQQQKDVYLDTISNRIIDLQDKIEDAIAPENTQIDFNKNTGE